MIYITNAIQAAASFAFSPLCVLAGAIFWTRVSNPLNVAEVFTVLSIIIIASEPFMDLLTSYLRWSSGLASFRRIRDFLFWMKFGICDRVPLRHKMKTPLSLVKRDRLHPPSLDSRLLLFVSRLLPLHRQLLARFLTG